MTPQHVAVVGGGYSGTLQAIELLNRGARVTLIERRPPLARGVAYGTAHSDHLLNVRARAMSALADRPDHFADWLAGKGLGGADDFAPRRTYGAYLGELLDGAKAAAGDRLRAIEGEAIDVTSGGPVEIVTLQGGRTISADAVVLALGNLPPERMRGIDADAFGPGVYVSDPWKEGVAAHLTGADTVLLIGTGLTAVDAALMLDSGGFRGRILALSRRGLLPRAHADTPLNAAGMPAPPEPNARALIRCVRAHAAEVGWRAAVDSLRPVTQALWAGAGPAERQRFLRHLRPWWDVHRHRIAPSIAARIRGMQEAGRLEIAAGKIVDAASDGTHAAVTWRARGSDAHQQLRARRIVNCTGPQADIGRAGEPLLDALLAAGRIRPDSCRIGIDVDAECRAVDRSGAPAPRLFAVGPMTKGAFWEIVAVPDIRQQVRRLAERLPAGQA